MRVYHKEGKVVVEADGEAMGNALFVDGEEVEVSDKVRLHLRVEDAELLLPPTRPQSRFYLKDAVDEAKRYHKDNWARELEKAREKVKELEKKLEGVR